MSSAKGTPKGPMFPDGRGGTLTPAEWLRLPQAERDRIQKLVDEQIAKLLREGTL